MKYETDSATPVYHEKNCGLSRLYSGKKSSDSLETRFLKNACEYFFKTVQSRGSAHFYSLVRQQNSVILWKDAQKCLQLLFSLFFSLYCNNTPYNIIQTHTLDRVH